MLDWDWGWIFTGAIWRFGCDRRARLPMPGFFRWSIRLGWDKRMHGFGRKGSLLRYHKSLREYGSHQRVPSSRRRRMNTGLTSSKNVGKSSSAARAIPPSLHSNQYVSIRPLPWKRAIILSFNIFSSIIRNVYQELSYIVKPRTFFAYLNIHQSTMLDSKTTHSVQRFFHFQAYVNTQCYKCK